MAISLGIISEDDMNKYPIYKENIICCKSCRAMISFQDKDMVEDITHNGRYKALPHITCPTCNHEIQLPHMYMARYQQLIKEKEHESRNIKEIN